MVELSPKSMDSTGHGLGLWHHNIGMESHTKSVKTCQGLRHAVKGVTF